MKIRCGSHQQNRSIVRPGLSLMATKVALTAEEFRENSQRSIALFNTEKLSTDSTHVLKSAYCNSVHFCRCNLHGACGGKEKAHTLPLSVRGVAICTERVEAKFSVSTILPLRPRCNLHGACGGKAVSTRRIPQLGCCCNLHGACGGKVVQRHMIAWRWMLQSARSVWRQRLAMLTPLLMQIVAICTERVEAKLPPLVEILNRTSVAICTERVEAKDEPIPPLRAGFVAICTERVEAKDKSEYDAMTDEQVAICTERVEAKLAMDTISGGSQRLQSARSVWRQRVAGRLSLRAITVAICTERVEAKPMVLTLPPTALCCNLHGACGGKAVSERLPEKGALVAICTERVEAKHFTHLLFNRFIELQSARSVWRQS